MKRLSLFIIVCLIFTILTGCKSNTISNDEPQESSILFYAEKAYVPVSISVADSKDHEGKTDTVFATDVKGDGIIREVSRSALMGDHFGAEYSIWGTDIKNARYTITPTEPQDRPIQLGMNYFYVVLEATFETADRVEIEYDSDITIKNVSGEFDFMVLTSNDENWNLGKAINHISGVADVPSDIVLTYGDDGYILSSDKVLRDVKIVGSETVNNKYIEVVEQAEKAGYRFLISYAEDKYIITMKEGVDID